MKNRYDNQYRLLRTNEMQRRDGLYVYQYVDHTGRRRSVSSWRLEAGDPCPATGIMGPALREMEEVIRRWLAQGLCGFRADMTVLELTEAYLATQVGLAESTRKSHRGTLRLLRSDTFGQQRIDALTEEDAKRWLIRLHESGKGFDAIRNHRGVLHPAFKLAYRENIIAENPFDFRLSEVMHPGQAPQEPSTPEQADAPAPSVREHTRRQKSADRIRRRPDFRSVRIRQRVNGHAHHPRRAVRMRRHGPGNECVRIIMEIRTVQSKSKPLRG